MKTHTNFWFYMFLIALVALFFAPCKSEAAPSKSEMIETAKAMEWKYSVPRGMLQAVCEQETRWRPLSVSTKGALGVCQIMPETFERLIRTYQDLHGLTADGIIGRRTWDTMRPGVPYSRQHDRTRLFDANQNIEWAAFYLRWIIDNVSTDASIIFATYYGGQQHQVVRYMREVQARWTDDKRYNGNRNTRRSKETAPRVRQAAVSGTSSARVYDRVWESKEVSGRRQSSASQICDSSDWSLGSICRQIRAHQRSPQTNERFAHPSEPNPVVAF